MKTLSALSLAALILTAVSASSFAGDDQKNTAQIQAANANAQTSIRHLRLRVRAYQVSQ